MAKVCQPAPAFKATALVGKDFKEVSLNDYAGKYVVLFFYPLDFTFVCPTEILAFNDAVSKFEAANVQLLGCSVDSQFSHLAWVNTPRKQGGLGGALNFPLLADLDKKISQDYGVLLDGGIACRYVFGPPRKYYFPFVSVLLPFRVVISLTFPRGLFIISDKGVVRHITMNDPPVGRR